VYHKRPPYLVNSEFLWIDTEFNLTAYSKHLHITSVTFGGLVIACLPLQPRLMGSKPAKDNGFLKAIKSIA
jgi:hypothetical protein